MKKFLAEWRDLKHKLMTYDTNICNFMFDWSKTFLRLMNKYWDKDYDFFIFLIFRIQYWCQYVLN